MGAPTVSHIPYPGIVGGFNILRTPYASSERTINMYVAFDQTSGLRFLAPTDGLGEPIPFPNTGPIRGQYTYKDKMYVVVGNTVYSVDSGLVKTPIGTLNTGVGFVDISANETQVGFVDGLFVYIYNLPTTTFTVVTDTFVPTTPICITTIDNYFVVPNGGTIKFQTSKLGDGRVWTNPITHISDTANFLSEPDILTSAICFKRKLYLFGQVSSEVWEDAGTADFPLRRVNNLLFNHGVAAIESVCIGFERLVYLSADRDGPSAVMLNTGSYPQPISTPAVDYLIQNVGDVSDAQGTMWRENGEIFYELNSTKGEFSLLYNFGSQTWTEQRMIDGTRHLTRSHAYFANKHYVGSYLDNNIYEMSHNFYTNFGQGILRERIGPSLKIGTKNRRKMARFEADILPGQGALFGNDQELTVYLALSRNNGITFGPDHQTTAGFMSEFDQRTIWRQLGTSRQFVPRVRFYNHVPFFITGSNLYLEDEPE